MTQKVEVSAEEGAKRVRAGQIPMSARVAVTLDLAASNGEAHAETAPPGARLRADGTWRQGS